MDQFFSFIQGPDEYYNNTQYSNVTQSTSQQQITVTSKDQQVTVMAEDEELAVVSPGQQFQITSNNQPQIGWLGQRLPSTENVSIMDTYFHDTYEEYDDTPNCFLDGRYFKQAFNNYPNVSPEPMSINIYKNGGENYVGDVIFPHYEVDSSKPILFRVVVDVEGLIRHSCLVIIEPQRKCDMYRNVIYFNPIEMAGEDNLTDIINQTVDNIAGVIYKYLMISIPNIKLYIESAIVTKPETVCLISGFCNAHVIKRAVCYLKNQTYNPYHIKKYAHMLERNYYLCPTCPVEEEYGTYHSAATGALVGGAVGAGLGGLVGGPIGAVAGLGVGALGGYALGASI